MTPGVQGKHPEECTDGADMILAGHREEEGHQGGTNRAWESWAFWGKPSSAWYDLLIYNQSLSAKRISHGLLLGNIFHLEGGVDLTNL